MMIMMVTKLEHADQLLYTVQPVIIAGTCEYR